MAAALAACGEEKPPAPADAGPPASATVATPEPPPSATAPPPPPPPPLRCAAEMVNVDGRFCVDRWEASLVDKKTKAALSPYYPPQKRRAVEIFETWDRDRQTIGSEEARAMELPPLPDWQRQRDPEPVAVSKGDVVPSGYVSGQMAALACKNAGKRLCRYDEWVTACEGEAKQQFPYGDTYKQGACNIFRPMHPAIVLHDDPSVGHLDPRLNLVTYKGDPLLRKTGATRACASKWGDDAIFDMNGNLDEWVEDEKGRFAGGFYSRSKKDGCQSVVTAHVSSYFDYSTGVRCCWSPEGSDAQPGAAAERAGAPAGDAGASPGDAGAPDGG
jgi:hypothetical protein